MSKNKKLWLPEGFDLRVQNLFRPILRFFASENKSRRKIYVDLDSGLKNYYWVIFGYEMAKKLTFL